jgi:hypothetical protein
MRTAPPPVLGILNDAERPEAKMLVVLFGKPPDLQWAYVTPCTYGNAFHKCREPNLFTPLSQFGVLATLTPDGRLALHQICISVAKYPDGSPRRWQGESECAIDVHANAEAHVLRAVRADFEARRHPKRGAA